MKQAIIMLMIVVGLIFQSQHINGQITSWEVRVSNNITGNPIITNHQLFYSNFHPGLDAGVNYRLNKNDKHQLYASGNIGVYYHRFLQTGIKIYPEFQYKYRPNSKWDLYVALDAGYILAFENVAVLELNDDGAYEKVSALKGRSQFMGGLRYGVGYQPSGTNNGVTILMSFATFLQGPFVNNYVPVLPYNSFNIGLRLPILKNDEND